jgi:phosphoglucomutase
MNISPLAGKPAPTELLIDMGRLDREYYERKPDLADPHQLISFGTGGHRGTPLDGTFTEAHILAVTQAICDYRRTKGITGPLFMGKDTRVTSAAAERTALEVLAANHINTVIQRDNGFTPTPVISRTILTWNARGQATRADGIVITPSHNPPSDGGFKYNSTSGGPADTDVTKWIQNHANELLRNGGREVKRIPYESALKQPTTQQIDYAVDYVGDLNSVIDMDAIRDSGIRIGVDPLGGAAVNYWEPIRERYGLNLTVVNAKIDPTFSFMTVDHDGKIRMDCSSPYAMAGLVRLKDQFDIASGTDPDADRHGIVTPSAGLMNPNHYLAVAIRYLLTHRPQWSKIAAVGKTLVSSSLIDRVAESEGRKLCEMPVGFKWFAPRLFNGSICFGGEESAGASFLRKDGMVWTTDKDGLLLSLLAAEITAKTGKEPGLHLKDLETQFGTPYYTRVDAPATPKQKTGFKKLTPEAVTARELAGDPIIAKLTRAPGNDAPIDGLKVVTRSGWFAARPSGTENIYKLYVESFKSRAHMQAIVDQAQEIVKSSLGRK